MARWRAVLICALAFMCTVSIVPSVWIYIYVSPNLIHGRPSTSSYQSHSTVSAVNLTASPVSNRVWAYASDDGAPHKQTNSDAVNQARRAPTAAPSTSKFFVTLVMPTVPREAANGERPNYLSQVIREYYAQTTLLAANHPSFRILVANVASGE